MLSGWRVPAEAYSSGWLERLCGRGSGSHLDGAEGSMKEPAEDADGEPDCAGSCGGLTQWFGESCVCQPQLNFWCLLAVTMTPIT